MMNTLILSTLLLAPAAAGAAPPPRVFSLDPQRLAAVKERLAAGDAELAPALARLREEADEALDARPPSVMEKERVPPSGDKHDFLSLATYWWPDPKKPDGLPYVQRDGQVNPEIWANTDRDPLVKVSSLTETLALAYYFTGREAYAEKAATLLRVWFLDPTTKMNPNLNYAQGIPGICTGRGIGIIDSRKLIDVADAVGLLAGSPSWTPERQQGIEEWYRAYLQWLLTSKNGLDESRQGNNHGTWYRAQAAAFALMAGDAETARRQVELGRRLIAGQIEPDGRDPGELRRTRPLFYSLFNLRAYLVLAELGRRVGVDVAGHRTEDGRSIRAAVDFLAPYFPDPSRFPYKQIDQLGRPDEEFAGILRRAGAYYPDAGWERLLSADRQALAPCRFQLLWPAAGQEGLPESEK